ncbi:MAG: FprA family A-type flavoprotein, partial [Planctomycetes bacterium]|nr:FprA family A-type flavoprotein [Planctomycetota bacterium]
KTALLDTVEPELKDGLLENLMEVGVETIDYIVAHHAEQDHSGSIPDLLTLYPNAKVVVNEKCKKTIMNLLHIEEDNFMVIKDGDTLSLGDKTLQFLDLPWVHWPETFGTYVQEDKTLFPCDFFGSHLADSRLFVHDEGQVYEAAKRYYAEIMMPFRGPIRKNLAKLAALDIDMIAPSHGPIYDKPQFIIDAYSDWVSDTVKNEVVIPFVSMHNSTRTLVNHLVQALIDREITVKRFDLTHADIGKLAISLVDAATVVIGSPTVLTEAHPLAAYAAILTNALRPKAKYASIVGSYSWAGKMPKQLAGLMPNLKAEILEPVLIKGHPKGDGFRELDRLADDILSKHKALGIVG